ncbi:predicted protein, partial [Naegleria gruberi]
IFSTSLQTLKSVKDTFFTGYFNDHFSPTVEEDDNAYFIDRPFEQFQLILNYLRGIDIKEQVENLNGNDLVGFVEEVVYYQITPIYEILPPKGRSLLKSKYGIILEIDTNSSNTVEFDPQYCSANLVLETPTRLKKTNTSDLNSNVLGTKSNHFKVKLISNCNSLMIGFAPKSINVNETNNNTKCGYYLYTTTGTIYSQNGESNKS